MQNFCGVAAPPPHPLPSSASFGLDSSPNLNLVGCSFLGPMENGVSILIPNLQCTF